jgi:hypothetical protein
MASNATSKRAGRAANFTPSAGELAADHPHSRVIAYFVREFFLKSSERMSKVFAHDYESAVLFLTISNHNAQKVMTEPALRDRYASDAVTIPPEHIVPVSRMALARATGLPRETVRRKVARLMAKGWVEEHKGGLCVRPDINRDARYAAAVESQRRNLRRMFDALSSSGALGGD